MKILAYFLAWLMFLTVVSFILTIETLHTPNIGFP